MNVPGPYRAAPLDETLSRLLLRRHRAFAWWVLARWVFARWVFFWRLVTIFRHVTAVLFTAILVGTTVRPLATLTLGGRAVATQAALFP